MSASRPTRPTRSSRRKAPRPAGNQGSGGIRRAVPARSPPFLPNRRADPFEGATMTTRCRTARSRSLRMRQGFTLIELLIVVVIIGILAAIAIPKFANTKEKAVVASMKSDLRNLASAQEAYWVENRTYYNGALPNAAVQFQLSPGVTVTIVIGNDAGWSAR